MTAARAVESVKPAIADSDLCRGNPKRRLAAALRIRICWKRARWARGSQAGAWRPQIAVFRHRASDLELGTPALPRHFPWFPASKTIVNIFKIFLASSCPFPLLSTLTVGKGFLPR